MHEIIRVYFTWIWISAGLTVACICWLFILLWRREMWFRWTAGEAAFWTRLGLPERLIASSRRFNESRKLIYGVVLLVVSFLALLVLNTTAYRRFNTPEMFFTSGCDEYRQRHYAAAIEEFDGAIALNTNYAFAYCWRGSARSELENYSGAIADCTRAIDLDSKYAAAYNTRGVAKAHTGDYVGAVSDYDAAITLNPRLASAYNNRAVAKGRLKNYTAALADFQKSMELSPTNAAIYKNRGDFKTDLKDYSGAISDYNKAIAINSNCAGAVSNRDVAEKLLSASKK